MELRHLRYFCAVAETLNFSRAAERLRVAQSALSRQVRDLENELGVQLLLRTTTSVKLTDPGQYFFQAAQKVLAQVAIAASGAQEIANGKGGDFNIASDWRLPMHLVPETVNKFRARNPKVVVNFVDLGIPEQIEALKARKIHLGFLPDVAFDARDDLESLQVYRGRLMAVLPTSHKFADRDSIPLRELAKEKWISLQEKGGAGFNVYLLQLCRLAGFVPIRGRGATSPSGMLALVAAGEGITLLPELVTPMGFGGVCLLETDCPPVAVSAVWLKKSPSPLVERYVKILRQEIKTLPH